MRALSTNFILATAILTGLGSLAGAEPQPRRSSPLSRIARTVGETRIAVSGGAIVGVPGLDFKIECGVVKAARGDPRRGGVFVALGGHVGVVGASRYLSPNPQLRGTERAVCAGATIARSNPVHGDRVGVGFHVASIAASRKGGLGAEVAAIPLPLLYPLVRGSLALYVANPGLSRASNAVVDRIDQLSKWVDRRTSGVQRWIGRHLPRRWHRK